MTAGKEPCPDEGWLAQFVDGSISPQVRSAVLVHLDDCPSCRRVVGALVVESSRADGPGVSGPTSPVDVSPLVPGHAFVPAPGTRMGRFEVAEVLGRGGMGVVLRARDPDLGRDVALKLVSPLHGSVEPDMPARQLREARALARLSHPNVVEVFDVGIWQARVFIAMELVRGQTLRQWRSARSRDWPQTLRLLVGAGHGLAAVHGAGLVHRDLKPDNILVDEDPVTPGRFRARIADFGLVCCPSTRDIDNTARTSGELEVISVPLTREGEVMGTPAYMAPEQHDGGTIDARTDVFSYCVTAYEALYDRRPFAGKTSKAIRAAVERGPGPCPRTNPAIPRRIHAVLLRGMAVDPTKRWASMDALLSALEHRPQMARRSAVLGLGMLGIAAASAMPSENEPGCSELDLEHVWPARRDDLRRRFAAQQAATGSDLLPGVERALDDYAQSWTATLATTCASAPAVEARRLQRCFDEARFQLVATLDVLVDSERADLHEASRMVHRLASAQQCDATSDAAIEIEDPEHRSTLHRGRALFIVGDFEGAEAAADTVLGRAEPRSVARARARHARGSARRAMGRVEEAREDLTAAFFEARQAMDESTALRAGLELSRVHAFELGQLAKGKEWLAQTVGSAPAHLLEHPRLRARVENARGNLLKLDGDLPAAREHLALALDIARNDEVQNPNEGVYASNLATVQAALGEDSEALESFRFALAAMTNADGSWSPGQGIERINYGSHLMKMGKLDDAERELERTLADFEANGYGEHSWKAFTLASLATVKKRTGRPDEALRHLESAREILVANHGGTHPLVAKADTDRAELLLDARDLEAAQRAALAAQSSLQASGVDPATLARTHAVLAKAQWISDEPDRALESMHRALEIAQTQAAPDSPTVAHFQADACIFAAMAGSTPAPDPACDLAAQALLAIDARSAAPALRARAVANLLDGNLAAAIADLERCDDDPQGGPGSWFEARIRARLANELARLGQADRARAQAERAVALFSAAGEAWHSDPLAQQARRVLRVPRAG